MKRLSVLLLIFTMISYLSCRHDTSELEKIRDTALSDVISTDSLVYDTTSPDINADVFDTGLKDTDSSDSNDISIDSGADEIPADDISDNDFSGDTEDVITDVISEEMKDTGYPDADTEDVAPDITSDAVASDAVCQNECEEAGAKTCLKINDKEYVSECKDLNEDNCLKWANVEFCKYGCEQSVCKSCIPDCTNKECDSDGCGGSCGNCNNPPLNYCKDSKVLIEYVPSGECINNKCKYSSNEITCQYNCDKGMCTGCTPDCENRNCGSDGCGGVCGNCSQLQFCNSSGTCECLYESCNGTCCDIDEVCYKGNCCLPECAGKECGPDKCGGVCGVCHGSDNCIQGICQPF